MNALRVIVLFALVATAAADDASTLRGRGRHPHPHHHKHAHSASNSAATSMRFRASTNTAAQLEEPAAPVTGAPTPVHIVPASEAKTDNVAREGLGENLPYSGMDCRFTLHVACIHSYV